MNNECPLVNYDDFRSLILKYNTCRSSWLVCSAFEFYLVKKSNHITFVASNFERIHLNISTLPLYLSLSYYLFVFATKLVTSRTRCIPRKNDKNVISRSKFERFKLSQLFKNRTRTQARVESGFNECVLSFVVCEYSTNVHCAFILWFFGTSWCHFWPSTHSRFVCVSE